MPVINIHQTLLDVATQSAGSAEALVQLANLNGLSITDEPVAGLELWAVGTVDEKVKDYFDIPGNIIAAKLLNPVVFIPGVAGYVFLTGQNVAGLRSLQTMLDAALIITGSAEMAITMAARNGLSITDAFTDGQQLQKLPVVTKEVVKEFTIYQPATGISNIEAELLQGIDYWAISLDFIVS